MQKIGVISCISGGNICDLPKVVGSCKAEIQRYYYDVKTDQCKRFKYSGCWGNNNNFKTRRDCATACHKRGKWYVIYDRCQPLMITLCL